MTRKSEKEMFPEGAPTSKKQEAPGSPIHEFNPKDFTPDPLAGAINAAEGEQGNATPNPIKQTPEDIFNDVEALRKVAEHKVQRRAVLVNMSVRKPPDNAYFQCHPDLAQRLDASLIFDKEERDVYFVTPTMMNHPLVIPRLRRVTIATTYLWPSGQIFLWPVPFPKGKGSVKCWKTARRAFQIACGLADDLDLKLPRFDGRVEA
jgi:hypothetical protein